MRINDTTLFSFLRSLLRENSKSLRFPKIFLVRLRQIIDLLTIEYATDHDILLNLVQ